MNLPSTPPTTLTDLADSLLDPLAPATEPSFDVTLSQLTPVRVALADLKPWPGNARVHNERNVAEIAASLEDHGQCLPLVVQAGTDRIIGGHGTVEAMLGKGWTHAAAVFIEIDDINGSALNIRLNRTGEHATWDIQSLTAQIDELQANNFNTELLGLSTLDMDEIHKAQSEQLAVLDTMTASRGPNQDEAKSSLAERFGVPPFSVLDARQGYWQTRKNSWLALGLRSFEGREDELVFSYSAKPPSFYELRNKMREASGIDPSWEEVNVEATKRGMNTAATSGTSIFDPVLAELLVRWFCPEGGHVLDPFAGGSVRGLVSAKLGRKYLGVDLRPEQVQANRSNWAAFAQHVADAEPEDIDVAPVWRVGDSTQLDAVLGERDSRWGDGFDFILSCPPYADLEKYSSDPADLSNMEYSAFLEAYRSIIAQSVARLEKDRFAAWVVGDIRDKKGVYRDFVSATIKAFADAGMELYNEAILITQAGSLPIRMGAMFGRYRKLGKSHQNVLIFYKGDVTKIPELLGATEFGDLEADGEEGAAVSE